MIDFENLTTEKAILRALAPYTIPLKNYEKFPKGAAAKNWQNRMWDDFSSEDKKDITGRAINCGLAGLVVIDLDVDKKTGEEVGRKSWEETCRVLELEPYDTFTVKSPSGGYHLYYAYDHTQDTDNPIGQSARLGKGVGIDVRGKNGLIVAPGSKNEKGTYRVLNALPIAPLPQRISAALKGLFKAPLLAEQESTNQAARESKKPEVVEEQAKRISAANETGSTPVSHDPDGLAWWQLTTLEQKKKNLAGTGEGSRDNSLASYSYYAGGDGIPVERVVDELLPIAQSIFNQEGDPGADELEAKIRRCAENGRNDHYDPNYKPDWVIEAEAKYQERAKEFEERKKTAEEKKDVRELTKTYTLAKEFMKFLKGTYKYVSETKKWIRFSEKTGLWQVDVSDDPNAPAVNIETILMEWLDNRERELNKEYSSVPTLTEPGRIQGVLSLLEPQLKYQVNIFDQQKTVFKAGTTVVDMAADDYIATQRPARATDYFTKGSNVPFDPDTDTTDFEDYISMFPKENRDYLQIILGQAMTGFQPTDPQVFFLYGDGSNGKSALQIIMSRVLGDYQVFPNTDLLLNKKGQDHQKMMLMGARCAYFEELPSRDYLNVKAIKDFVGSGSMTASRKYENEITFKPFATIFINTNHLPRVRETEDGAWRRLVVIDFPYEFKENPNPDNPIERKADPRFNPNLIETLDDDHPLFKAALLWMLEGANKWFKSGMVNPEMPEDYVKASQRWQNANDRIGDWWNETVELGNEDDYVLVKDLYESFRQLTKQNGQEPGNKALFLEDLERHKFMKNNGLSVKTGRVASLNQSVWFDPEKSWKDDYRPLTPAPSSKPEHIRGLRFIGTAAPDSVEDIFAMDKALKDDVSDIEIDEEGNIDLDF